MSSRLRAGSPKILSSLLLEREQSALDGADASRRHPAVSSLELVGVVTRVLDHGPEVLEVEEEIAVVVGDPEDERQDTALDLVKVEQARKEQGAHVRDRRPNRVALRAEDVPEDDRAALEGEVAKLEELGPLLDLRRRRAGLADPGQVAFDVGHEDRHPDAAEVLGHDLERDGLARARGPGHESVPVRHARQEVQVLFPSCDQQPFGRHFSLHWSRLFESPLTRRGSG
jgi:hypothetical protein